MMPKTPSPFDDLEDDFDGGQTPSAPLPGVRVDYKTGDVNLTPVATYKQRCPSCGGSGRFRGFSGRDQGECFKCKGKGELEFKTSPGARNKAKATRWAAQERKDQELADSREAFKAAHPAAMAWLERAANRDEPFEFAVSLLDGFNRFGRLTDGQLAAVERIVAKNAEKAQARVQAAPETPTLAVERLTEAFNKAAASGLKRPKLRFERFEASLAPSTGKNPGAIYLKAGETYLGKIADGRFFASREATPEAQASIMETMADPAKAAKLYGQRTGSCSVCGAELTNGVSIERGIGPICAERYGF